ncbi:hypothetical protein [Nonomuraea insulae]|uniref:Uncharacterized protein n=1 Tax=Nonomuraea insulae TaxID=1616787 RepID=A0ABW1CHP0_9ACTN
MTADRKFSGWRIMDGAGGGYIAYRAVLVPGHSGLSNVRCGATMKELFEHLEQEVRRQEQLSPADESPERAA